MNRHSLLFIVTIFLLVACGGGGTTTLMPEIEMPVVADPEPELMSESVGGLPLNGGPAVPSIPGSQVKMWQYKFYLLRRLGIIQSGGAIQSV